MKPVYIVAEAGVNHNGSVEIAKKLIDIAVFSGADAVKFQTFKTEDFISKCAPKAEYQLLTTEKTESQLAMIERLEFSEEIYCDLKNYCDQNGIDFLSSPFDIGSVDILVDRLGLQTIKLGSGEITNGPLLLHTAGKNKSVILSTGMSSLGEIENALSVLAYGFISNGEKPMKEAFYKAYCSKEGQIALKNKVALLHCTTQYPAPFDEVNLKAMDTLKNAFGLPVGYSDHTEGIIIPLVAVARGATIIEKHFTLDKHLPGPDHKASLEPDELKKMVSCIRIAESSLGDGIKRLTKSEIKNKDIARKSLVTLKEINKGDIFSEINLGCKRPGTGLSPMEFWHYIGCPAKKTYKKDTLIEQ